MTRPTAPQRSIRSILRITSTMPVDLVKGDLMNGDLANGDLVNGAR